MFIKRKNYTDYLNEMEDRLVDKIKNSSKSSSSDSSKILKSLEAYDENLQSAAKDINSELSSIEDTIKNNFSNIEDTIKNNFSNKETSNELNDANSKVSEVLEKLYSDRVKKLESDLKQAIEDKNVVLADNAIIKQKNEELEEKIKNADKARMTAIANSGNNSKNLKLAKEKITTLEGELKDSSEEKKQLAVEKEQLSAQLAEVNENLGQAQTRIKELEKSDASQKELIQKLTAENNQLKSEKAKKKVPVPTIDELEKDKLHINPKRKFRG